MQIIKRSVRSIWSDRSGAPNRCRIWGPSLLTLRNRSNVTKESRPLSIVSVMFAATSGADPIGQRERTRPHAQQVSEQGQSAEHRAKLSSLDRKIAQKWEEVETARADIEKIESMLPIEGTCRYP
jgi:hypothetical protein